MEALLGLVAWVHAQRTARVRTARSKLRHGPESPDPLNGPLTESHRAAAAWWHEALHDDEEAGVCAVVAFASIRLATDRKVFRQPLSVKDACARGEVAGISQCGLARRAREHTCVIGLCPRPACAGKGKRPPAMKPAGVRVSGRKCLGNLAALTPSGDTGTAQ